MVDNPLLHKKNKDQFFKCTNGKVVRFSWQEQQRDFEIQIPPLGENQCQMWGDWGPMYTIEMQPDKLVQVKHSSKNLACQESYSLENKIISVQSPTKALKRDQQPLFYVIEDIRAGLVYHIFMDKMGQPNEVKVLRGYDMETLFVTLDVA